MHLPPFLEEAVPYGQEAVGRLFIVQGEGVVGIVYQCGWEAFQRVDQAFVPLDLDVEGRKDLVVGEPFLAVCPVLPRDLVEGVCQVERIILFLGIKHQ